MSVVNSPNLSPASPARSRWRIVLPRIALGIVLTLAVLVLLLGAFPVGLLRGTVESRLSRALRTQVHVGSITRDSVFSYTPVIAVRDVRIAQPAWAGVGDFVRVGAARVRVPVFALLFGTFRPDKITVDKRAHRAGP